MPFLGGSGECEVGGETTRTAVVGGGREEVLEVVVVEEVDGERRRGRCR